MEFLTIDSDAQNENKIRFNILLSSSFGAAGFLVTNVVNEFA